MKYCTKCGEEISENNPKERWTMHITKLGQKIIEFECFHFPCWKEFWDESMELGILKINENRLKGGKKKI